MRRRNANRPNMGQPGDYLPIRSYLLLVPRVIFLLVIFPVVVAGGRILSIYGVTPTPGLCMLITVAPVTLLKIAKQVATLLVASARHCIIKKWVYNKGRSYLRYFLA